MTWSRAIGGGLLALAAYGTTSAEQPAIAPLLKPLNLTAYPKGAIPPDFTARAMDDRELSLANLRGKVVIVNFWASWCLECRPEMPVLERLHRDLGARGLAVIGINAREAPATARRYAGDLGLSFLLVLDLDGKINALYGVIGLPTTFLIGRDGRAVALAVGPRDWESPQARAVIEAMLAEPAPARDGR
jgi:cytochrome c biogenesis protein CcmG, thiol:disulfide interchange protein DsbE